MALYRATPASPEKASGRPKIHTTREILDTVFFYVLRSSCPWRLLPHDFPPWKTVYHNFRKWRLEGDWEGLLPKPGFEVLPRRWVVERRFAWTDQNRRMSKDYERVPESKEAFVYVAMSRLMVRRLARQ